MNAWGGYPFSLADYRPGMDLDDDELALFLAQAADPDTDAHREVRGDMSSAWQAVIRSAWLGAPLYPERYLMSADAMATARDALAEKEARYTAKKLKHAKRSRKALMAEGRPLFERLRRRIPAAEKAELKARTDAIEAAVVLLDERIAWFKLSPAGRRHREIAASLMAPAEYTDPAEALSDAHATFQRWLGSEYDLGALRVMLASLAIEKMDGEPLWPMFVSGSGNAKTETVGAAKDVPGVKIRSSLSGEAALLSGTSSRERAADATGGLLAEMTEGTIVLKDVTTTISMSGDRRGELLAALREVYDGSWSRDIGGEGGRHLAWEGRICVIGAVTGAWDSAHEVIAQMGPRFVVYRVDSSNNRTRLSAGRRAIGNIGSETVMREELAAAVARAVEAVKPYVANSIHVTDEEMHRLLNAANVVSLARTAVTRDYRGDVVDVIPPEAPTRVAKQLAQVVRGGIAIGLSRRGAMTLAIRCASDSVPPILRTVLDDVAEHPTTPLTDVQKRLDKPRATVDRALQTLHALGLLTVDTIAYGQSFRWLYTVHADIDVRAIDPERYTKADLLDLTNPLD